MNGMDEWQKDYNERLRTAELTIPQARVVELERADARRKALEDAIKSIESLEGIYRNDIYRKAWKVATEALRRLILGVK
jgi:hypothetical protein